MTVERASGNARDFFVVDDGVPVLYNGDHPPDQRDVIGLPFSRPSWLLRRGSQKTVDSTHVMATRLLDRIGFYLHFVAAPQDRKSTRLNSSHGYISYAVFCLKKK